MEDLNFLTAITAVPASVVIVYIIWKFAPILAEWMKKKNGNGEKRFDLLDEKLDLITGNHLSHVVDGLKRIEDILERMNENNNRNFSELKESLAYVKAKINGHK